jgi:hypothetical protein
MQPNLQEHFAPLRQLFTFKTERRWLTTNINPQGWLPDFRTENREKSVPYSEIVF